MTAGHFGLAAGVKKWAPRLPLWVLLLSTYLLDVIFIVLFALGVESFTPVNSANGSSYGGMLIHAYYTHSLVGSFLIAGVAGWLASRFWGRRPAVAGVIVGARLGVTEHRAENARIFSFQLDAVDWARLDAVQARSRDLFKLIGDCGDEYRR